MAEKVKNLPAVKEILGGSLDQEDPLKEEKATHSVFLPGEFHDKGAWWAAVHGVTESRTLPVS